MRVFAKAVILILSIVLVLAVGTFAGEKVWLENNFDGDSGNDTGAAIVSSAWAGTANPNTGYMMVTPSHGRSDFAAATGYDVSTADSLTVTWTVSSFTTNDPVTYVWHEGWFFGVRGGTNSGALRFKLATAGYTPKVGFCVVGAGSSATYNWSVTDLGTNAVFTVHSLTNAASAPTVESLMDGFTAALTIKNDDTWELVTSGLSSDVSTNGTLSANVTFAELATNAIPITTLGGLSECTISYVQLRSYTTPAGTVVIIR